MRHSTSPNSMKTRSLGSTGLAVSEIGFGAASLGNLYAAISDDQADATVQAAWEAGIRYFDTAPHYGLGLSERRLGRALRGRDRSSFVVSTKVGRLIVPREPPLDRDDDIFDVPGDLGRRWDFSEAGIRASIEASLDRAQLDRIDIAYLHDPDRSGIPGAAQEGAAALLRLRDEGLVTAVGIGSNSVAAVTELLRTTDIDLAMLAGRYTLLEDASAGVFDAAAGRPIVVAGAFNSGLLATDRPLPGASHDYAPAPEALIRRANRLADIAEAGGATLPQAAIAYPLRNAGVASVVLGMASPEQVRRNLRLYSSPVPAEVWNDIEAAAAVRRD
jgi:D-threo-aldose 1-dehydrogenase